MTEWRHGHERQRLHAHDRFDPVVEGARHGLSREQSLAIWKRVCASSPDGDHRADPAWPRQRFHDIARRIAAHGGQLRAVVGRMTRVGVEIDGMPPPVDELALRVPGRQTRAAEEASRRLRADGALAPPVPVPPAQASVSVAPPEAAVYRDAAEGDIDPDAAARIAAARTAGSRPLPPVLRAPLEAALGVDLDRVRVHDHAQADAAARALGARAFTIGSDIFFRRDLYQPDSRAGQRLIAHEVAHTQQPGGASTGALRVSAPGDAAEREADAFADRFADGVGDRLASTRPAAGAHRGEGDRDRRAPAPPRAAGRDTGVVYRDPEPRESAHEIQVDGTERERIRLFGLDELYARYREYIQLLRGTASLGAVSPRGGGTAMGNQAALGRMREELTAQLRRHGFQGIEDFERSLGDLVNAIRTEAQRVAGEMLDRYEGVLTEQQQRYRDPGAGAELHQQLGPARGHYQRAAQIRRQHARVPWTPGEVAEQSHWSGQFHDEQARGRSAVAGLSPSHPLLGNSDIPHEELATADPAQVGPRMQRYIADRRRDVERTRRNVASTPDLVFELDTVMATTFGRLGMAEGALGRRVIADRNRDRAIDRAMIALALAVLALAAGLVSMGTGTAAVIGGTAALGIGAYQAHEEFRRYETMHAAHGAQLTSEDPSFAWVIVALAGVGLDAAAVAAAVARLRPAIQAFNETRDVAALEAQLARAEERVREAVLRGARLEAESRAAWQAVARSPAGLRAVLVPGAEEFGRLVYAVYLSARRGIARFELWVRTREAVDLIGDAARLSPENLAQLKTAYQAAVRDMNAIARHGQGLGMTEAEIAATLQRWGARHGGTADDVMREMTEARGAGRAPGTPPEGGAALREGAPRDGAPRGQAPEGPAPSRGTGEPWTPPRGWNGPANHGRWDGPRGNSGWIDERPEVLRIVGRSPTGEANPIPFRNGVVDFTRWSQGELTVAGLTGEHANDMMLIRLAIAERFNLAPGASRSARAQAALDYLRTAPDGFGGTGLRPHHAGGSQIQLVPRDVHKVQHTDLSVYPRGE